MHADIVKRIENSADTVPVMTDAYEGKDELRARNLNRALKKTKHEFLKLYEVSRQHRILEMEEKERNELYKKIDEIKENMWKAMEEVQEIEETLNAHNDPEKEAPFYNQEIEDLIEVESNILNM